MEFHQYHSISPVTAAEPLRNRSGNAERDETGRSAPRFLEATARRGLEEVWVIKESLYISNSTLQMLQYTICIYIYIIIYIQYYLYIYIYVYSMTICKEWGLSRPSHTSILSQRSKLCTLPCSWSNLASPVVLVETGHYTSVQVANGLRGCANKVSLGVCVCLFCYLHVYIYIYIYMI